MITVLLSFAVCFLASALAGFFFIPVLKKKHIGQKILEIGPSWHMAKEGTPTMGGLFFLLPVSAFCCLYVVLKGDKAEMPMLITLFMAFAMALVGFADDLAKLRHKQNEGLTPIQKMIFQFIVAAAYLYVMRAIGAIDESISLFFVSRPVSLGIFYYVFCLLFLVGMTNSVNLTDGIDGLCSAVSAAVCAFFLLLFHFTEKEGGAVLSACIIGALFGFLIFNRHPAKVFMGDTGSMFLGGATVGLSFLCGYELLIMLIGIVYVIEILSVVIQVSYHKLTGKRLFKMAPIHHHFERCGWSENKIVLAGVLITVLVSAFSVLLYFIF